MYGYIYITTNLINNKKYIGKHKSNIFDIKYIGSGTHLLNSIKTYGKNNFECHILESINNVPTICETEDDLNASEEYYIDYYKCVESEDYYNLKPGGKGKSESGVIYVHNDNGCKKIHPEDLDKYILLGYVKGGHSQSDEFKQNTSKRFKGKSLSETHKLKIARSNTGKKASDETKRKLSNSHKGKTTYIKNHVAVRLPDDTDYIYVDKSQLDYYLSIGYVRGAWNLTDEQKSHYGKSKGHIYINNGIIKKCVDPNDVDTINSYLKDGWNLGGLKYKKNC